MRTRDRALQFGVPGYIALMNHNAAPVEALEALARLLILHRSIGSDYGVVHNLREWLPVFGQLHNHEMVALVDGATPSTTIWRTKVDTAIATAVEVLGASAYEAIRQRGSAMSQDMLHHELLDDIGRLATSQKRVTE
jgi:hypothetical protein